MKIYSLKDMDENINEVILKDLEEQLTEFETQKESDEYKNTLAVKSLVEKFNFSTVQSILQSDGTAFCWLNNSNGKVYVNVKNKKGYRYPVKESFLGAL